MYHQLNKKNVCKIYQKKSEKFDPKNVRQKYLNLESSKSVVNLKFRSSKKKYNSQISRPTIKAM